VSALYSVQRRCLPVDNFAGGERDIVRFAFVIEHVQGMFNGVRCFRLAEIEREEDHHATPGLDHVTRQTFLRYRYPKWANIAANGAPVKLVRFLPAFALIASTTYAIREVSDQHFINEPRRAVLRDRRGLRQEGHVELRRVRVAGKNRRIEKDEKA
jgi:hypothetical protein